MALRRASQDDLATTFAPRLRFAVHQPVHLGPGVVEVKARAGGGLDAEKLAVAFNDIEMREWFTDQIKRLNPAREDLRGTFDYLDLDDYVSFGGIA